MVIMVLEKVTVALRGDLTRWLIEVRTGVYIGHVNAMVRDKLWERCCKARRAGSIFQAWNTNNEQRFSMRMEGCNDREVVDWEGLYLVKVLKGNMSEVQKRRTRKS
jgi:CRISPR-associated protein Cas2